MDKYKNCSKHLEDILMYYNAQCTDYYSKELTFFQRMQYMLLNTKRNMQLCVKESNQLNKNVVTWLYEYAKKHNLSNLELYYISDEIGSYSQNILLDYIITTILISIVIIIYNFRESLAKLFVIELNPGIDANSFYLMNFFIVAIIVYKLVVAADNKFYSMKQEKLKVLLGIVIRERDFEEKEQELLKNKSPLLLCEPQNENLYDERQQKTNKSNMARKRRNRNS